MPPSRFPIKLFLFAFFGWAFDFYDLVLLGFLKDDVARAFHLGHAEEAWMLGVALGASGAGGVVAGALADRVGKRTMLAATIGVYSLGSLASGLAPSLGWFLAARAVVGLGVGGEWAIGHAMVAEAIGPHLRGRGAAMLQSGEPVGVALAALVGYVVMPRIGWRWVLVSSAATGLLALAARRSMHLPDEPAAARVPLARLASAGMGTRLLRAWLLGVFKLGTYWTCYTWLPSFLKNEMHQGVGKSLAWMSTAQAGQLAGMLSFGVLSDRMGRRPAFSVFSALTAAAIAPLAFGWAWLAEHAAAFWACMLLLGYGSGCTAGFGALLAELYPTELRALSMGATYNLARAAQLGAPLLVAQAVAWDGLRGGLSVPLALAICTASWVWTLPETRGIALPRLKQAE